MSVNREVRFQEEKGFIQEGWPQKCTRVVSEGKDLAVLGTCATAVKKPVLGKSCRQGEGCLGSQEE